MEEFLGYKIVETLYEGRGIHVFRGEHQTDHTQHIVKALISGSPEQVVAFRHEYQINHGLQVPGVVHCQQLIEKGDRHLLVFEDAGGITLRSYLEDKALDLEKFFPIAIEMVSCLEDLHSNRVIHKDIKPDNVLVDPETLAVKLLDLSISTQLESEIHEAVSVDKLEGSLAYIAPEQTGRMNRPMDYRSDYYALGFTFFEMLTGRVPFVRADALGYVHAHMAVMPEPVSSVNPNVPEMLSKIVAKLVSKQAEDRYQSTEGLKADLQRCFQEWNTTKAISDFPLGEHEAYYKLVVSPKIFGRDEEIATLMSSFERVARGASECLLISGNSGVGKSRLVNEVQWPIIRKKGYFVRGKFDLLQRSTPYTAFIEAFTNLFKHWLCLPEAKFQEKREKLNKAMGQYGQVIVEFFPYLEKVMGKQPEIDKLPPEQAQNRFLYHFQSFIECISSPEEPVVMFIDDLQWIDQASLRLLEIMLTTQDVRSLLFIGAYRDNEVEESHPFIKLMDKLKKANGSVKDIVLRPLKLVHTQEFLSDSLRMDKKDVLPLAEILFEKTAGNPFFSLEFLKECFAQKLLTYDHNERLWHWDQGKISSMVGTDNVIDLMLSKIGQLPKLSQKLLQIGSCLGMNFDSRSLHHLNESDELEILEALSPLLNAGMLQRINKGLKYQFIHDRIQQAAYQTLSDEEKQHLHLNIGRMLLGDMKEAGGDDKLFEILDHFKLSSSLLTDGQERLNVAEFCLRAGRQANQSGAFQAAESYLGLGQDLTQEISWEQDHQLLMGINMAFLDSLSLQNRSQDALDLSYKLMDKCASDIEEIRLNIWQIKAYYAVRDFQSTLEKAMHALNMYCGLNLVLRDSKARIILKYALTRIRYGHGKRFIKNINNMTEVSDEKNLLITELFYLGAMISGILKLQTIFTEIILGNIKYLDSSGGTQISKGVALGAWGYIEYKIAGSFKEFDLLSREAFRILQSIEMPPNIINNYLPGINITMGCFLKFDQFVARENESFQNLVAMGNIWPLYHRVCNALGVESLSDKPLSSILESAQFFSSQARKINGSGMVELSDYVISSCHYLQQNGGKDFDYKKYELSDSIREMSLFHLFNSYFSEDYEHAEQMLEKCRSGFLSMLFVPHFFYYGTAVLIYSQLYPKANRSDKRKYLKYINRNIRILKGPAGYLPENYMHIYLMSLAELARIRGKKEKALDLYHKAIAAAKEHDYLRWTAIANERVGELYMEMGEDTIASVYIHEAIYYYQHWGCMLKVKLLNRRYGALLIEKHLRKDPKDIKPGETGTSGEGELDLTAMLKASQAISSEIQLDKLLPRILQVVVESSGADKAAFIGLKKEDWVIESVTEHKGDEFVSTTMNEVLTPDSDLPEDFISNSIRAGEMETLSDMSQSEKYASLTYVQQYRTRSALCLPIVRDGKVLAALYLENQMTADTFTPERVQLLKALSAQIAISLENARYFEHTQELFRSTERFVPKKFLELLGRNNIEEVTKGDNVKLEMSAIFADLRDFTTISENIEPEQLTFVLNTYLKYMSPIIRNNHGFVNRVLGDGILALFPNDPQDAVKASLEMLDALKLFNQEINAAGLESVQMGIGVNTGPAMLCALGEDERIEANVVSDMVNAASRIEGLNKLYGTKLLISDLTYNKLKDLSKFSIRLVDTVRVKGKTKPLSLYEVMPKTQDGRYFEDFQKALNLYTEGKFKAANQNFIKCLKVNPDDAVAQLYAERCMAYQDNTPENWDGITTMMDK